MSRKANSTWTPGMASRCSSTSSPHSWSSSCLVFGSATFRSLLRAGRAGVRIRDRKPEHDRLLGLRWVAPGMRVARRIRERLARREGLDLIADPQLERAGEDVDELDVRREGVDVVARAHPGRDPRLDQVE